MRISILAVIACLWLSLAPLSQAQDTTILPTDDPSSITINTETSNNTSACLAAGNPLDCTKALPPQPTSTANANAGAQTTTVDAVPEHISTISVHRLMYKNWNGKLLCEYQPWFSEDANPPAPYHPYNGHIEVGYDETKTSVNAATVKNQNSNMIARGCNINFIDFYGSTDQNMGLNKNGADAVYTDLASRTNYPLKLGILEDIGAFKTACSGKSEGDTITCVEGALETDLTYIHQTYIFNTPGVYWSDQGTNVVGFFGACAAFPALETGMPPSCTPDWDKIWTDVQNYVNNPPNSFNMKFIFQFGNFDIPTISAGEYAWPQLYGNAACQAAKDCFTSNTPSQWWWCDSTGITCNGSSGGYLDQFYYQGSLNNPGHLTIGALYKGFDDSNANWTTDRVIAEQCGQVFINTANEVTKGGYWGGTSGTHQIPYMQIATWNDYEEGTEVESGVDNCYTAVNLSLPTGTSKISWTLTSTDSTYATTKTIHHYALWTAPPNGSTLTLKKQLGATLTQFDLATLGLAAGTYDVYLEMVGQPSTQNEMSSKVSYTQH